MKHSQSGEDYLETILLLSGKQQAVHRIDVARAVGVSQPAVQKAIKILIAQGYVQTDGMHIQLTQKGREYACSIYERHCTIRTFLRLHGVSDEVADTDACEMEHVISPETYEMMQKYIAGNCKTEL